MPLFEAPTNESEETRESGSLFNRKNLMIAGGGVVFGLAIAAIIDASTGPSPSPISGALRGPEIKERTRATRDFVAADTQRSNAAKQRLEAVQAFQRGDEGAGRSALERADAAAAFADEAQQRVNDFLAKVDEDRRQAALAQAGVITGEVVDVSDERVDEQQAFSEAAAQLGVSEEELMAQVEEAKAALVAEALEEQDAKYGAAIEALQAKIVDQEEQYQNLLTATVSNAEFHRMMDERNEVQTRLDRALEILDEYVKREEEAAEQLVQQLSAAPQVSVSSAANTGTGKGRPTPKRPRKGAALKADLDQLQADADALLAAMTSVAESPEIVV